MSQVLITGATGLVGDHLLRLLIQDRRVNYIAAPTRRPLADLSGVFNPHDPQLTDALASLDVSLTTDEVKAVEAKAGESLAVDQAIVEFE